MRSWRACKTGAHHARNSTVRTHKREPLGWAGPSGRISPPLLLSSLAHAKKRKGRHAKADVGADQSTAAFRKQTERENAAIFFFFREPDQQREKKRTARGRGRSPRRPRSTASVLFAVRLFDPARSPDAEADNEITWLYRVLSSRE